jgi:hypothetical protein
MKLNKAKTLEGYKLDSLDGEIGTVKDFYFDDQYWAIRFLVIDTHNWLPGKKVLVSPKWIESVSWSQSKIFVNLTREKIKQSPAFTDKSLLTRDYEAKLYQHYNCPEYWVEDQIPKGRIFNKNIKETAQL